LSNYIPGNMSYIVSENNDLRIKYLASYNPEYISSIASGIPEIGSKYLASIDSRDYVKHC